MDQNEKNKRIMEISKRLAEILVLHGRLESNIPVNSKNPHEYWTLKDELNVLRATP